VIRRLCLWVAGWGFAGAAVWAAPVPARDTLTTPQVALPVATIAEVVPLVPVDAHGQVTWRADSSVVAGFGNLDLAKAIHMLPGVSMDTRGLGGSRRLNVRGTALRSPFGVRNTVLIVDGFVLTEADGTSPLEWLEPMWTAQVGLSAGPAAAAAGGAYGGVLEVESRPTSRGGWVAATAGTTGSGSLQRQVGTGWQSHGVELRAAHTRNPGYRDWEWNERTHAELHVRKATARVTHHAWMAVQRAAWALPGAIHPDSTPTLSPGLLYQAAVHRNRALVGHHFSWTSAVPRHKRTLDVWALARVTDKFNPYGTSPFFQGMKEETGRGTSVRARLRSDPRTLGSAEVQVEWNALWLQDAGRFQQWEDAILGNQSPLVYDLRMVHSRLHATPSMSVAWRAWRVEMAAGLALRIREAKGVAFDLDYDAPFTQTSVLPKVGVSRSVGNALVFGHFSGGYSDPTNFESLSLDAVNQTLGDLQAEDAWGLEGGVRGNIGQWALYHQRVQRPIVEVPNATDNRFFVNDSTPLAMSGMEAMWRAHQGPHRWTGSGALQVHRRGNDPLPGSPAWMVGLNYEFRRVLGNAMCSVQALGRGVGPMPLGFETPDVQAAYATLDVQVSADLKRAATAWTVGVRNASNTTYSSWSVLDAFGGKHFNPAPPRTWFVSARWGLGAANSAR